MSILKKLNVIHYWALLNVAVPLVVELVLGSATLSGMARGGMINGAVLLLLMGNIYLLQRPSKFGWLIGLTLVLNLAALLMLGSISFFSALLVLLAGIGG